MRTNSEYHVFFKSCLIRAIEGPVSPLRPEVHIETLPSEIEQVKKPCTAFRVPYSSPVWVQE